MYRKNIINKYHNLDFGPQLDVVKSCLHSLYAMSGLFRYHGMPRKGVPFFLEGECNCNLEVAKRGGEQITLAKYDSKVYSNDQLNLLF